jgi:hypothetical protein
MTRRTGLPYLARGGRARATRSCQRRSSHRMEVMREGGHMWARGHVGGRSCLRGHAEVRVAADDARS